MSADNGIYILETNKDYRVIYGHSVDNIYGEFNDETGKFEGDLNNIKAFFENAKVFTTLDEALDYAENLSLEYNYLEDGICVISDFKDIGRLFE